MGESMDGFPARLMRGMLRKKMGGLTESWLRDLKTEAERRAPDTATVPLDGSRLDSRPRSSSRASRGRFFETPAHTPLPAKRARSAK
jgi:hypothetical protein